jgi:hypothetical protein
MPGSVLVGYQSFGGSYCLHLQGEVIGTGKRGNCIGLKSREGRGSAWEPVLLVVGGGRTSS